MTETFLSQQGTVVLDSNGEGTILFKPDTGQFWSIHLAHTSIRSNNLTQCDLHMGGLAALQQSLLDPTTIRDATILGNNDTSSILSGDIVFPGNGIAFHYTGGFPGDVAFATIIGTSYDIPPTLGAYPDIPGARFVGSQANPLGGNLDPHGLIFNQNIANLASGSSAFTPLLPVNAYSDLTIVVNCFATAVTVQLNWYTDGSQNFRISNEEIDLNSVTASAIAQSFPVKGAYLQIQVRAVGAGTAQYSILISGVARPHYIAVLPNSNTIIQPPDPITIAAGASSTQNAFSVWVGPAILSVWTLDATAPTAWQADLFSVPLSGAALRLFHFSSAATTANKQPAAQFSVPVFLPACPTRIVITNNDAASKTFGASLIAKPLYQN